MGKLSSDEEHLEFRYKEDLKIRQFQATVDSVLLYGSETWTIFATLSKQIEDAISACCEWPCIFIGVTKSATQNFTVTCQKSPIK